MKKKILLIFVLLLCVLGISFKENNSKVNASVSLEVVSIESTNVAYADYLHLMFAVKAENVENEQVDLLVWDSLQENYIYGSETYKAGYYNNEEVNGADCLVYYSNGIAVKKISEELYVRAHVKVDGVDYYSDVKKASILIYLYEQLNKDSISDDQRALYQSLLDYASNVQKVLNYNSDKLANGNWYKIEVVNGLLNDGFNSGYYYEGTTVTIKANEQEEKFSSWKDSGSVVVSNSEEYTFSVSASNVYTANYAMFDTIAEVKAKIDANISGVSVEFIGEVIGFDSLGYAHVGDSTGSIYVRAKNDLLTLGNVVKISGTGYVYTGSANYPEYTRQISSTDIVVEDYDDTITLMGVQEINLNVLSGLGKTDSTYQGNVVSVTGTVSVGSDKYNYYLLDDEGNKIVQIHHYSNNFANSTSADTNEFVNLNGKKVCLTGVVYRYYEAYGLWSVQCIGLANQVVQIQEEVLDTSVSFYMINDTHGAFVDDSANVSIGRVSTLLDQYEESENHIVIANGDIFQGTYVSNVNYGLPLIESLNAMEADCFVLGNHEFDWGLDLIQAYKDGDESNGEANFPFLGANIYEKSTGKMPEWLEAYTIIETGGVKVGIIGVIGSSQESSILTPLVADYDFVDLVPVVEEYAIELRTEKDCDVVVVANHDYEDSDNVKLAALSGDARIDAIFCAHTHTKNNESKTRSDGVTIPIVQNYDKNELVTQLVLEFSDDLSTLDSYTVVQTNPNTYAIDSDIQVIIDKYADDIAKSNEVVGTTTSSISKATLGSYAVSAMKEESGADFAIINTGGVRTTIAKGDITIGSIFNVFPFSNTLYLVEMTGAQIKSLYDSNSSYLYIDSGYNSSSISDSTIYTVAVLDYVYHYSYYSSIFKNIEYNDTGIYVRDVVIEYIDNLY